MATPPGVGKTSAREAIAFSHADGQVGFPPAISTAASSGHSVMAYQSPEILLDHLEGEKCNLARLQGNTSRGYGWTKAELTRCAKVGYYPSCTSATLVAVPATYATGEFPNMKARSL